MKKHAFFMLFVVMAMGSLIIIFATTALQAQDCGTPYTYASIRTLGSPKDVRFQSADEYVVFNSNLYSLIEGVGNFHNLQSPARAVEATADTVYAGTDGGIEVFAKSGSGLTFVRSFGPPNVAGMAITPVTSGVQWLLVSYADTDQIVGYRTDNPSITATLSQTFSDIGHITAAQESDRFAVVDGSQIEVYNLTQTPTTLSLSPASTGATISGLAPKGVCYLQCGGLAVSSDQLYIYVVDELGVAATAYGDGTNALITDPQGLDLKLVNARLGFGNAGPFGVVFLAAFGALPVELTSFTATALEREVQLNWTTATETDNDYFVVERSGPDGLFKRIGEVPGSGTTLEPTDYSFVDDRPISGTSYYRLCQFDYDGSTSYSEVVSVHRQGEAPHFAVYPNPVHAGGTVTVETENPDVSELRLYSSIGKPIPPVFVSSEKTELDVSSLTPGIYTLQFVEGNNRVVSTKRLLVQ